MLRKRLRVRRFNFCFDDCMIKLHTLEVYYDFDLCFFLSVSSCHSRSSDSNGILPRFHRAFLFFFFF